MIGRLSVELDAVAILLAARRGVGARKDLNDVRLFSRAVDHLMRGAPAIDWRLMSDIAAVAATALQEQGEAQADPALAEMMWEAAAYSARVTMS